MEAKKQKTMETKTDGTPRFFRGRQFKIVSMDNFDKLSRARDVIKRIR
jgi:hypothetical protein